MDGRSSPTLTDLLRHRAEAAPGSLAYRFLLDGDEREATLTYAELDRRARAVAARLETAGARGGRALVMYAPGLDYLVAFFGCLYAGATAVPVYPPEAGRALARLRAVAADARPGVVLASREIRALLARDPSAAGPLGLLPWLSVEDVPDEEAEGWRRPEIAAETLAFLQYTSGSTGMPKGVMLTHANLLANQRAVCEGFGHDETTVFVGWLPLYHDMGLIGNVMHPLWLGVPCTLMSPRHFLERPARWLRAVSRYRGTTSGGPNFAWDYCAVKVSPAERAGLDLSSWRVAFNGAEPVRADTLERFARAFAPEGFRREAFYPCYGLAEASLFVSGGVAADPPVVVPFRPAALERHRAERAAGGEAARPLVGCGRAWGGERLRVVDPDTLRPAAPGEVGELWVAGPSVAAGYWGRPEESEATFGARTADGEGPYLRTGDLGFVDGGELFVTGRRKDLIIVRGTNHYPQDLERTAETSDPLVRPGGSAAFALDDGTAERVVVVAEVRADAPAERYAQVAAAIRDAIAREHELRVDAVELLRPGTVPKTSSGKIQRHACREGFSAGTLDVLHRDQPAEETAPASAPVPSVPPFAGAMRMLPPEHRETALLGYLQGTAARVLETAGVEPDRALTGCGLDSLRAVVLLHRVREDLGVELPASALFGGATLRDAARALAQRLDSAEDGSATGPGESAGGGGEGEGPASYAQRALWFMHQVDPAGAGYNLFRALRLSGPVDAAALRRALEGLVVRHPALRTVFPGEDSARVGPAALDFAEVGTGGAAWDGVRGAMEEEGHRPFDLEAGPLFRARLYTRAPGDHVLLLAAHHAVMDLWSLGVVLRDLDALYTAAASGRTASLPPLRAHPADAARAEARMLGGAEEARLWAYWRGALGDEAPPPRLATDRPRPGRPGAEGGSVRFALPPEVVAGVERASRDAGVTLFATLFAAFQAALREMTGADDVRVATTAAVRGAPGMEDVVGHLVNAVVVRTRLDGESPFTELARRTDAAVRGALDHATFPYSLLVSRMRPARGAALAPLYDGYFVFQRSPNLHDPALAPLALGGEGGRARLGGVEASAFALEHRATPVELLLNVAVTPEGLSGWVQYRTALYDAATAERLGDRFSRILARVAADPRAPLAPPSAEPAGAAPASTDDPGEVWLHLAVERQAARTPDAVAVVHAGERLTYAEVNARANRLAHRLRARGARPGEVVAVLAERSADLVTAFLGVLKSGATYLPLDPGFPPERVAVMLRDGAPLVVVAQEALAPRVAGAGIPVLEVGEGTRAGDAAVDANPVPVNGAEDLAYVLYTSGSTGEPKGVEVRHGGLARFVRWIVPAIELSAADRVLGLATPGFDISILELLVPLAVGARAVVLAGREAAVDGAELARAIAELEATLIEATPTTWRMLLAAGWRSAPGMRLITAGERLTPELAEALLRGGGRLLNLYGPTEATVYATSGEVLPRQVIPGAVSISAGRPPEGAPVYLLDEALRPVAQGDTGEMYLGGSGLARGYLRRPALTAAAWLPDPNSAVPGARMYRTGDLARRLEDGGFQVVGRADHQIKVRGNRVEPGEVEVAIRADPRVRDVVVMLRGEGSPRERLVAYLDADADPSLAGEVQARLRTALPSFMVPAQCVVLPSFPRTSTGKTDRKALPEPPEAAEPAAAHAAPENEIERRVARIWADLLKLETVGVDEHFFDVGGHSLLMGTLRARLEDAFGRRIPIAELFQLATVRQIAAWLVRGGAEEPSAAGAGHDERARLAREALRLRQARAGRGARRE